MEEYLNVYLICCWHVLSMIILGSSLLSLCWHIGLFVSFWFKFTVSLVDIWFVGFILSCCLFESSCSGEISGGKNYVLAGGRTKCIGEITTTFFNVWGFLRACLVCIFKQPFSVFKQHFTHFNTLFHSHVLP